MTLILPEFRDVLDAQARLQGRITRTPVMVSHSLNRRCGVTAYFKCEHLQRSGAFKARGALNAVWSLNDDQVRRGVVTHSSGNHGGALAMAARDRGVAADIVIPKGTARIKIDSIRRYGGRIHECDPNLAARESMARAILSSGGGTMVHPYDDPIVISGQATATTELLAEIPDLDVLLAPVSGGGLLSGAALAAQGVGKGVSVVGVEPAEADDAARSLRAGRLITEGNRPTLADGLRASLSERTLQLLQKHRVEVVTVTEEEIIVAMKLLWDVLKQVVEPSGAVPFAALACGRFPQWAGKRVGLILSGGNVDVERLPWS